MYSTEYHSPGVEAALIEQGLWVNKLRQRFPKLWVIMGFYLFLAITGMYAT